MGMGATKQVGRQSTPAQGGKGGGKNIRPGMTNTTVQPAQVTPVTPVQQVPTAAQPTYTPIGAQGGKAQTGQLPAQGKGQIPMQPGQIPAQGKGQMPMQPGQIPPQGGKGTSRDDYNRMMAQVLPAQGATLPTYEQWVQQRTAAPSFIPAQGIASLNGVNKFGGMM